mmetsp:Transcript_13944/g.33281  ORF Transcript_13944/g.33281 Transcript_13944/m.33281 type:complete len:201 (+) Transcript_13944:371-973(+)
MNSGSSASRFTRRRTRTMEWMISICFFSASSASKFSSTFCKWEKNSDATVGTRDMIQVASSSSSPPASISAIAAPRTFCCWSVPSALVGSTSTLSKKRSGTSLVRIASSRSVQKFSTSWTGSKARRSLARRLSRRFCCASLRCSARASLRFSLLRRRASARCSLAEPPPSSSPSPFSPNKSSSSSEPSSSRSSSSRSSTP